MSFVTCSKGHQVSLGARFCQQCSEPLPRVKSQIAANVPENGIELPPGTRLRDRYVIQQQLGQGGFGKTYLAEDTGRFHEKIVIKEFVPTVQGTQALEKAEELFQREAITLHQLQHPQIPRFWETFREGKRLFLVEDFIEGQTYQFLLEQRLQQGQYFKEAEILQLFRQLLPVLSYLHRQGVIHRDISPDNIMLRDKDQQVVLIDMGGVKQVALDVATQMVGAKNSSASSRATCLGKVGYAPDEQLRLGIVAPHSDLYALAVTALVLMTGKQPQELLDQNTMNWMWHRELSLSPILTKILNRMLHRQPSQRFKSADEILQLLQPSSSNRTYAATKPTEVKVSVPVNNSGQGSNKSIPVPGKTKGQEWGKEWGRAMAGLLLIVFNVIKCKHNTEARRVEPVTPPSKSISSPEPAPEARTFWPTTNADRLYPIEIGQLKTYTYPSGLFSLDVPTGWRRQDKSKPGEAIVFWTDKHSNATIVVDLFATQKDLTQDELSNLLQTFLTNSFRSQQDFEIDPPQLQGDNSVAITWSYLAVASNGTNVRVMGNSFIGKLHSGNKISILFYVVPAEQLSDLQTPINQILNSYKIDSSVPLP